MTTKEQIIDSFLDDGQRHSNKSIGWGQIGQMMDEYAKQQIFAFMAFREDQLALGFIPSGEFLLKPIEEQYAQFIEHQNQKPTNE